MEDNIRQTVFVTGSNRGLGAVIIRKMAQEGYNVIAHARKENTEFETGLQQIAKDYSVDIRPIYFDLTDGEAMREEVKKLFKEKTTVDVLVNCAGMAQYGAFSSMLMDDIRNVFDVNLFSQMELTQYILRIMTRNRRGCIVNIASIAGIDADKGNSAYGVSKAALISWTKVLAVEVAGIGIRVNAVAPGMIDTDMAKQLDDNSLEKMISESAMNRLAKPEEIANAVAFLASEKAAFINGEILRVDGGK